MALAKLGGSISRALHQVRDAPIVDENVLNECLYEIRWALLQADVQFRMVYDMFINVKKNVNLHDLSGGHNKFKIIQLEVANELCKLLFPGMPSFTLKKGRTSVVMFVGLQGSGKTTTCTKYACYHKKKGWKPALVCADTVRTGAFDQLKENASKATIPFYGSYMETDPVKIATEGVEQFTEENFDLIIVDTSGHKEEAPLFEEMHQMFEAVKPDLVVYVMNSSIGQAAFDHVQAFKQTISVGAVIVTNVDSHAKGVGALSALSRTKCPVIFIGTGEHMDEFEVFDVKPLVSCLLGTDDWSGYMNEIHDFVPMDRQPKLLQKLSQGNFTSGVMSEQFQSMPNRGSTDQVVSMIHCTKELNPRVIKRHLEEAKSHVSRLLWNQRLMKLTRGPEEAQR
ncbi:signal recognition particle subunit SRP54 2-like isoform X2 [Magnolia sinica]|uniref:signal recognition particle subunit SRP54 2-like isoform X2 n=1 Tax=Magnolia sinica TaxID=86752 RepID=UPI00265AE615|nr:signal recognition particle subunit SRP54 2-like isoform X2 [Magnolia sinica]